MKEKQGGLIPTGLKRWPLKLIKHLADTTCVQSSIFNLRRYRLNFALWYSPPKVNFSSSVFSSLVITPSPAGPTGCCPTHGKYPDEYFLNLYELGETSAECLHFAGPLSIAITDFVRAPYALYSEQPFCFRSV